MLKHEEMGGMVETEKRRGWKGEGDGDTRWNRAQQDNLSYRRGKNSGRGREGFYSRERERNFVLYPMLLVYGMCVLFLIIQVTVENLS